MFLGTRFIDWGLWNILLAKRKSSLGWYSERNRKLIESPPWKVWSPTKQCWPHCLCSFRRRVTHYAFSSIIDSWSLWWFLYFYPRQCVDQSVDSVGDKRMFSRLDRNCRYLQVQVSNDDFDAAYFTSHHGLFRCTSCDSDWRTTQKGLNERWMYVKWKSNCKLPWFVAMASSCFSLRQENISNMFAEVWLQFMTKLWHSDNKKCKFFIYRIEYSVMSIFLAVSSCQNCQHAQLKSSADLNTQQTQGNSDFLVWATLFPI